jgi:hypothetical protein
MLDRIRVQVFVRRLHEVHEMNVYSGDRVYIRQHVSSPKQWNRFWFKFGLNL